MWIAGKEPRGSKQAFASRPCGVNFIPDRGTADLVHVKNPQEHFLALGAIAEIWEA